LQTKAWGASLLITAGVLCLMLVVRLPVLLGWIRARVRRPMVGG